MIEREQPVLGGAKQNIELLTAVVFWSGVCLALLPFIIMATYVVPAADDFCFAAGRRAQGWLDVNLAYYRSWTGRYASTAMLTFLPLELYGLYPVVTLAGLGLALHALVRTSIGRYMATADCRMATATILVVYINMMPLAMEGLYWLPGSVTYLWANFLSIAAVALAIHVTRLRNPLQRIGALLLLAALCIVAAGMNESTLLMMVVVLAALLVRARRDGGSGYAWFVALVCFTLGAVLVLTAPGNSLRADASPAAGDPVATVRLTTIASIVFTTRWLATGPLILGSLLLLPMVARAVTAMRAAGMRAPGVLFVGAVAACVIAAGFAPPSWGLGMLPPGRTLNAICMFFILAWLTLLVSLMHAAGNDESRFGWAAPPPGVRLAFTVLFVVTLLSGSVLKAYGDMGRTAATYGRQNAQQESEIRAARAAGVRDVELTSITAYPGTLAAEYFGLQQDPTSWINVCFAKYAGFRSVRTRAPE